MEAYLRYTLMTKLSPSNSSCSFVAKQIARLPWYDPSEHCGALVCRIMMKAARKGRYKTIQAIAMVAANLRTQKSAGEATVRLVDAVLEELRWSLECPNFRDQQRTLTYARLLGELYCSSQVSAQVILKQLYDFINLTHEIPDSLREASKKMEAEEQKADESKETGVTEEKLPVYNSTSGVAQTIQEDEEMDDAELETKQEGTEETSPEMKPVAVSEYSKYDPRVPSPQDPPNSAYRIKLVCTLLEVAAKQIASRNNLPRVKGFLTAFQRYLFTKTMLPTDVEFALLDTFDILDSQWKRLSRGSKSSDSKTKETGFPRYATWMEAHNATVAIEESEALFAQQQRAKLASGMGESKDGDGISLNDDEDSASSLLDEDDDGDDLSMASSKESVSDAGEFEEARIEDEEEYQSSSEGEEESDSDGGSDAEDEDEFDEEAHMQQLEEEAFERELRRLTMDALEKGKNVSRKIVADYMPSGSQIIKKKPGADSSKDTSGAVGSGTALGGKAGISFQVLKKGNKGKVEAKELIVPADTNLAMVATKQDDEKARERDVIKQRVLQYEAESAEAELSGGNVYLEQEKLQVIRNRPLSMAEIDKNFGTSGGNLRGSDKSKPGGQQGRGSGPQGHGSQGRGSRPHGHDYQGRGSGPMGRGAGHRPHGRGGGRAGRGRGRSSSSGRSLFGA